MASNTEEVYIRLLNEGAEVFRPTRAGHIRESIYRLLATDNYDPDDEEWEFLPGTLVRCEIRRISDGRILLAVEKLSSPTRPFPTV